ncbi:MAG: hypothetical protein KC425_06700 [Anaerolineales bacterium]|nr:hypothetical protein [Anaerolineales bacterium]
MRRALENRLRSSARIDLVAPACNLAEGRRQATLSKPDVVLLGCMGNFVDELVTLAQDIRELVKLGVMVIVLVSYSDDIEREIALHAGATRYLLKDINTPQLIAEIEAANPRLHRHACNGDYSSLSAHSAM